MADYFSPGVYMEEFNSSPRTIEGVGTSIAGFVGLAAKGPSTGAPQLVTSFAEYLRLFGGYLPEYTHNDYRFLPYCVEQFFENGGAVCYVARVIPSDAKCATGSQGPLTVSSANEGKWGNRVTLNFLSANRRKMQLLKSDGGAFLAKSTAGFREGNLVEFAGEVNRISTIYENTVVFEKEFKASPVDTALVPKKVVYSLDMDVNVRYENETENYSGVSLDPSAPNYIGIVMSKSKLVSVDKLALAKDAKELQNPVSALFGTGKVTGTMALSGGSDGSMAMVNGGTFIGTDNGPGKRTGIQAFKENSFVSILAVPGITIPEVTVALVNHCEQTKNRFAVLDMPFTSTQTEELLNYRELVDSSYAAMYHPWVQIFDRLTQKTGFIPPSGAVAGVYARTDTTRGVHKAPANETIACTGLSVNYTNGEQDILNPAGINLIRALPGQGIRVWGARSTTSNNAFKYVNVRRLFIYVEESIKASTNWVVFEPNTTELWGRVQMTITSFLDNLFRLGMLAGSNANEAFFVNIGTSTMSRDDIMNGRLICEIGIAPSRPAEFVIFRLTQFTAESGGSQEEEAAE